MAYKPKHMKRKERFVSGRDGKIRSVWVFGPGVAFIVALLALSLASSSWPLAAVYELVSTPAYASDDGTSAALDALKTEGGDTLSLDDSIYAKYASVPMEFLDSSMALHDQGRNEKTGMSDALTFGFSETNSKAMLWELEVEILRNPVVGLTYINALKDKCIGGQSLGSLNPWMEEASQKQAQAGTAYWLEQDGDGFRVTEEYRQYAIGVCVLLEKFSTQGVESWQTIENWCLNMVAQNSARAGVKASYQHTKKALILTYTDKNGASLFTFGADVYDKRPEFYGTQKATPAVAAATGSQRVSTGGGGGTTKTVVQHETVYKERVIERQPVVQQQVQQVTQEVVVESPDINVSVDVPVNVETNIENNVNVDNTNINNNENNNETNVVVVVPDDPNPPKPDPPKPDPPKPDPPTPEYDKDPADAPDEYTEPNDDLGPGPDTNNGEGATESTADQPENSNHMDSYEEYVETIENLEEINDEQLTGEDPSVPTYTPPVECEVDESTDVVEEVPLTVDNNGDTGTDESDPINDPTPVTQLAIVEETGLVIEDEPGEPWGGPQD